MLEIPEAGQAAVKQMKTKQVSQSVQSVTLRNSITGLFWNGHSFTGHRSEAVSLEPQQATVVRHSYRNCENFTPLDKTQPAIIRDRTQWEDGTAMYEVWVGGEILHVTKRMAKADAYQNALNVMSKWNFMNEPLTSQQVSGSIYAGSHVAGSLDDNNGDY